MKKGFWKLSSLIVTVVFLAVALLAVTSAEIITGDCGADGDNVTYTLDTETGVLEIIGGGAMDDYLISFDSLWNSKKKYVKIIKISIGITSIGEDAFWGFSNLANITIPDSVTSIGDYAFCDCSSLTSLKIPDSVTSIGHGAFSGCLGLTNITIPDSVTDIGDYIFRDCRNLKSARIPANVGYLGTGTFIDCSSLTDITIENGITSISSFTFDGCSSLKSISIPASVSYVQGDAFSRCDSLVNISVSKDNKNFCDADGILFDRYKRNLIKYPQGKKSETYKIPDTVSKIDQHAFHGCIALTHIEVGQYNSYYCDVNGVLFSKDMETLVKYPCGKSDATYTIPNGVKGFCNYAFESSQNLKSVIFPNSVTDIGGWLFESSKRLSTVSLPDSITSLGYATFYNCANLTSITIPDNVTCIEGLAFYKCRKLSKINIPASVVDIQDDAFEGCYNIKNVYVESVENWLTIVGNGDLYFPKFDFGNWNLYLNGVLATDITIPDGTIIIPDYAFLGVGGIENITMPDSVVSIGYRAFSGCSSLININMSNGLTSIGEEAFSNCKSLKKIFLPENISDIGYYAFDGCCNLESIEVATGNGYFTDVDGILFNKRKNKLVRYPAGKKETAYNIPDSVTTIDFGAFNNARNLANIEIGQNNIWFCDIDGVLYSKDMEDLIKYPSGRKDTTYTVPKEVERIRENAFELNENLVTITLPVGLSEIYSSAFAYCKNLKSVVVPNSVSSIQQCVFDGCIGLMNIQVDPANTSYCDVDGVLYSKDMGVLIKYPYGKIAQIYTIPNGVTDIDDCMLFFSDNPTAIAFPESVHSWPISHPFEYSDITKKMIYLFKNSYADTFFDADTYTKVYITGISDTNTVTPAPSVEVASGNYSIKVVDKNKTPISGATVTWGAQSVTTGADGIAVFINSSNYPAKLTIKATGLADFGIPDYCVVEGGLIDVIEMSKIGESQIIPMTCNGKSISTSYAKINVQADMYADIVVKGVSTVKINKYELKQGGTLIASSLDGAFHVKNSAFKKDKPVVVHMYTSDGRSISKTLNIRVISFGFKSESLVFGQEVQHIKVPSDVTLFGGLEFKFSIGEVAKIDVEVNNDSFKVGFNMNVAKTDETTMIAAYEKLLKKWKLDPGKNTFTFDVGGYIVGTIGNENVKNIESQIVLNLNLKSKYSTDFIVLNIPLHTELEFSNKAQIKVKVTGYDFEKSKLIWPSVDGSLTLGISAKVGVGVSMASIGVYGSMSGKISAKLLPIEDFSVKSIVVTGQFGVYAKVLLFEAKYALIDRELVLYDSKASYQGATPEKMNMFDSSEYMVQIKESFASSSAWNKVIEGVLIENAYNGISPEIISAGGVNMMVYIDDSGNDEYNYHQLVYSFLTDTGWSASAPVDANNLSDSEFDVFADGENIWVIYTQASKAIVATDTAESVAASIDVLAAKFNKATGEFDAPIVVSDNTTLDLKPQITVVNGTPVIVWVNNADNNVFGMTANNTIYLSQYKSGKWSSPVALATNVPAIIDIDVGSLNSEPCLAAIHDTDSDFNTTGDGILRVYKADGTSYSYESGSYESVTFEDGELYWYKDFSIYTADKFGGAGELVSDSLTANSAADFEIIDYNGCKYILYRVYNTEGENGGSDLYAIVNSGTGWSAPVRLTNTEGYIDSFDVLALDGSLMTVYRRTDVSFAGGEMTTSCELCSDILELSVYLDIQEITYDYEDIFGDDSVTLKVIIINKGADIANGFTVAVGSATKSFDTILAPGATAEVEILCDLSETETAEVIVTDENKISVSKDADVHHFDFETNVECKVIGGSKYINATVRNNGNIEGAGTLYIRRDSKDGKVIYSEEMILADGNQKYILLEIVDKTLKDVYIEFVASEGIDYFDGNNSSFTAIPEDMAVVYGDPNGDGTINAKDAVLLAQKLANWDVNINEKAADCNGDGDINAKDAVLLAQYLAGWDVVLG